MTTYQMKVDIHYADGTEKKIGLALGTLVAYELAFEKSFAQNVTNMHTQAWVTWRQCQKMDPDTPSFEEWMDKVDRLYIDIPKPPDDSENG